MHRCPARALLLAHRAFLAREAQVDSKATVSDPAETLKRPWLQPASRELVDAPGMSRREFAAMGTTISLLVQDAYAEPALQAVESLFNTWQDALSRFHPE